MGEYCAFAIGLHLLMVLTASVTAKHIRCMEQSPSWVVYIHSASKDIAHLLWIVKLLRRLLFFMPCNFVNRHDYASISESVMIMGASWVSVAALKPAVLT
jgi:hypothetical protein